MVRTLKTGWLRTWRLLLRSMGGVWEGTPTDLHGQLKSDFKPPRADELSKSLKAIAGQTPGFTYEAYDKWVPDLKNKRRFLRLVLENGGNGGNGGKEDRRQTAKTEVL